MPMPNRSGVHQARVAGGAQASASAADGAAPPALRRQRPRSVIPASYRDSHPFDDWLGAGGSGSDGGGSGRLAVAALRQRVEGDAPPGATSSDGFAGPAAAVAATWQLGEGGTSPTQLAQGLLRAQGFRQPVVIRAGGGPGAAEASRAALGLHLPAAAMALGGLVEALGPSHQVGEGSWEGQRGLWHEGCIYDAGRLPLWLPLIPPPAVNGSGGDDAAAAGGLSWKSGAAAAASSGGCQRPRRRCCRRCPPLMSGPRSRAPARPCSSWGGWVAGGGPGGRDRAAIGAGSGGCGGVEWQCLGFVVAALSRAGQG